MELEVGMYVRTTYGFFAKCIGKNKNGYVRGEHYSFDNQIKYPDINEENNYLFKEELNLIKKVSYNIIDLIEVGDYVNGIQVEGISIIGTDWVSYFIEYGEEWVYLTNENIKSIVTKEQFESMAYKVGK